jgi:hypothetical protein
MKKLIVLLTLIIVTNGCGKKKPVTLTWDPVTNAVGYDVYLTTNKVLNVHDTRKQYIKVFLKTNSVSLTNIAKGHYKAGVTTVYRENESEPSIIDVEVK